MPNYFAITKKGENKPANFVDIDAELCEAFDVPCDPKKYFWSWYDTIGLAMALGKSWDEMREIFEDKTTLAIVDWLEKNYTYKAWSSRR